MAKAATTGADPSRKKTKKKSTAASAKVKAKKPGGTKAKKASGKSKGKQGLEALAKLADHPMIADLLAAGALAAVAAVAEHQLDKKKSTSSKLVKSAGQAAAAAIGKKLMDEFGAIKTAATAAAKKA